MSLILNKSKRNIPVWTNDKFKNSMTFSKSLGLTSIFEAKGIPLKILLTIDQLHDEKNNPARKFVVEHIINTDKKKNLKSIFLQIIKLNENKILVFANNIEKNYFWSIIEKKEVKYCDLLTFLKEVSLLNGISLSVFPCGSVVKIFKESLFQKQKLIKVNSKLCVNINLEIYPENITEINLILKTNTEFSSKNKHLSYLEDESIHIIREAFAESNNPVMLYSIGKDSAVMLHLAIKAFYPNKIPFPLLHVDTGWKFKTMYFFREHMSSIHNFRLIIHSNPDGIKRNINPFTDGSEVHTDIMKTQALKQALDKYKFDIAFGGARRDEEKSRAKERVFSFRNSSHLWDPKNQRAELWNLYNVRKKEDENIRVFPLSNWTEIDIWEYILEQNIAVVPLYLSAPRPVIRKNNSIFLIDDNRFVLNKQDKIEILKVRFRTLGCYPLTGAIISDANSVKDILKELLKSNNSERQGRVIDSDPNSSMESKKKDGYF